MADGPFDPAAATGAAREAARADRRGPAWIVAMTQPRKEGWAEANLRNQGYETFLPRLARVTSHARRRKTVLAPLFPRYLFVRVDFAAQAWRPILGTFGVSAVIMDGPRPRRAPPGLVDALAEAGGAKGEYDFSDRLRCGESVRFLSGPFADAKGRLTSMDEAGRVRVLLEVLGASREVSADARNLIPAG